LPQLIEQSRVPDGDAGLFREIAYQLNLLVGEGPHLLAVNADHADELVLLQHRNGHKGPRTAVFCDRRVGAFHRHVCDLDRAHNVDCVRKARGRQARRFFAEFRKLPWRVMQRDTLKFIAFDKQHRAKRCIANARRVRQYDLEHWLERARRARDDLEHFGGRGLPLQRLGQLARALLLGLEQPHVLDRDHRLVGERPQKRNLLIRKRINLGTSKLNCADRHPLA
jgi:hypothetical protein